MGKKSLLKKATVFAIITIFFTTSILPTISGNTIENNEKQNMKSQKLVKEQDDVDVTFYSFGLHEQSTKEIKMSYNEVEKLLSKISEYSTEIAYDSRSGEAQELQQEIFALTDELGLLPESISTKTIQTEYNPLINIQNTRNRPIPILQNRASAFFCNFATTGTGSQFPIIIFPRLIPIIQLPIPRVFLRWTATEGITSCGGLLSGKGFIAYGQQKGLALGFWGIGFSIFLPPFMQYGFIGYALYVSTSADVIELWPPNYSPEITAVFPSDGAFNIPISTSELRFHISDLNGDLMDYIVTTDPDIGSGIDEYKPDGTYSIPISGLEGTEEYSWHVQVSDGEKITDTSFSFTTEPTAPFVYDPSPENDEKYVPVTLSQLSFKLDDLQDDLMDYTVETVPNIGSGSGTGVGDGMYTVDINNLAHLQEYIWYVNVTDGVNWKHKVFSFQTEPILVFNPFDEGWQYRKEIIIDHSMVDGDLENFPILVSIIDNDLRDKAQDDGDDILFMNDEGTARRLYHEIELFDDSSGNLISWINVTSLNSDEDTIIYMYYGNPDCSSQQHPIPVWDSGYEAVWHMNDATISSITDSTLNDNTGNKQAPNNPLETFNGKIGAAQDFERSDQSYITAHGTYAIDEDDHTTFSAWIKQESNEPDVRSVVMSTMEGETSQYVTLWVFEDDYDPTAKKGAISSADNNHLSFTTLSNSPCELDTWYYITGVMDKTNEYQYIYIDGIQQNHIDDISDLESSDDGTNLFFIGVHDPDNGYRGYWDGFLDELRVSNIPRSPAWISTEYNNQQNPTSFLSYGPEEPAS